jgi:hypothetical protein
MINVNYQKRKNGELFKKMENPDSLFLSKTQNYIPIYKRFFQLNDTNFNHVNLNHSWYICEIHENIDNNINLFECSIKHNDTKKVKNSRVFFKFAPLLDPYKYLVGKYDTTSKNLLHLPSLLSNETNSHPKLLDTNNSAYVDGFFLFLSSKLLNHCDFIHGIDYYGSFLSIKNDYKINIFDDLEYLSNSDFFNKNKNNLFQIDSYEHLYSNEKPKLKPLVIQHNETAHSILSLKSLNHELFETIFDNELVEQQITIADLVDMNNVEILNEKDTKTTTLKSGSSCSSRTSFTSSSTSNTNDDSIEERENSENDSINERKSNDDNTSDDQNNNNQETDEFDDNDDNDNDDDWEDIEDEDDDSEEQEEEKIHATFPKFPVQVICMEYCENTFDDLILNNELSEEEWFSALMQIIMILITYQKTFSFTHNDLHTNNVMYNSTNKKFLYYKFNGIHYKVPTFGRIFKIIDFGRSIYKFNGNLFCSDSFQNGGDAATQYNIEPYFNKNKPRLEPNFSFDLCRLACSIFDYLIDDLDEIKDLHKCENPVIKIIVEWCLDDKGINLLYKNNGSERYPDFKLYKMIARHVHNHTPQAQLERNEFKNYIYKKEINLNESINDIDKLPVLI